MAGPSWWDTMLAAIRAQESGGNYAEDVSGCLGAYCWNNQASWDNMARAAGQVHLIGQNPASLPPQDQDFVASNNLGRIYSQTHSLTATLEWWNGGQTKSVPNPGLPTQRWAKQCGGGSTGAYACQVETRMKLGGHYLATGSGSGGTVQPDQNCLLGFGGIPGTSWIADIFGNGGNIGQVCLLTRSEARAIVGFLFAWTGALMALPAIFLLVAGIGESIPGAKGAAEKTGAAVALIPGAEGAGVAIAGAGKVRSASQTRARRAARQRQRQPRQQQQQGQQRRPVNSP